MAERVRVQWSQLPEEILSLIAKKHLSTRIDNLRLRSVCGSWRSSIPPFTRPPPPPPLPPLLPSQIALNRSLNKYRDGYFSLTENTVYLLLQPPNQNPKPNTTSKSPDEPFHSLPWLVRVEEFENGEMRALHPLSQIPLDDDETFPKVLNLLNFRITEIGKAYGLRFIDLTKKPIRGLRDLIMHNSFPDEKSTLKAVVSSSPSSQDDYAVMAIFGGNLWFFKLGDNKWTAINDDSFHYVHYDDFVYHNGQFYAVGSRARTVVIGSDLKAKPIEPLRRHRLGSGGLQLVKSCGDLFLIDKHFASDKYVSEYQGDVDEDFDSEPIHPLELVKLKVFKLNETKRKWERIKRTLGDDRVLFACDVCSYSVSARDFTGLKGDCIYFSDDAFGNDDDDDDDDDDDENEEENEVENEAENEFLGQWCADVGVFSFVDGRCGPLAYFPEHSQIFWPPPPWLNPTSCAMKK